MEDAMEAEAGPGTTFFLKPDQEMHIAGRIIDGYRAEITLEIGQKVVTVVTTHEDAGAFLEECRGVDLRLFPEAVHDNLAV